MALLRRIKRRYARSSRSAPPPEQPVEKIFETAVALDVAENGAQDREKAAALYHRAAEKGHVTAMYTLANLLVDGAPGVPKDQKRAVELYERAINEGSDTDAMFRLACLLREDSGGVVKDLGRSLNLLEQSAELGNASAMNMLGILKAYGGEGVVKNGEEAVKLFTRAVEECEDSIAMERLARMFRDGVDGIAVDSKKAAELYERSIEKSGNTEAICGLGVLYCHGGDGVPKDVVKGAELFERAIREGEDPLAMINLAWILSNEGDDVPLDVPRAVELYRRAVYLADDEEAICELADWLSQGEEGVERNMEEAIRLLEYAISEFSSANAMTLLGKLLLQGQHGVKKDTKRGIELLERAVNEGQDPTAMHILGAILCEGEFGVEPNGGRGIALLERAIEKGEESALTSLGNMFDTGTAGVVSDEEKAVELFTRAIEEHSDCDAMYNLSNLVWDPLRRKKGDRQKALKLLDRAIEEGHPSSMNKMGALLVMGKGGIRKNPERAKHLYRRAISEGKDPFAMHNLGLWYENKEPRTSHTIRRAVHFYEMAIKHGTAVDEVYTRARRSLAKLVWKGGYELRREPARAIRLLQSVIDADMQISDVKRMAKWVVSGEGGTRVNLDKAREQLRTALSRCTSSRKQSELRELLEKCNRTTMISLQDGEVTVRARRGQNQPSSPSAV